MKKKFDLTRSEVNLLIAALMMTAIGYDNRSGASYNKAEAERYSQLENKFRDACYYGDEIATVSVETTLN